jgi:peroxiredoxin Q/BCP
MASITVGDQSPDFTLPAQTGAQVSLAEFRGNQAVVLFFYPKDGTAVCTKEACSFRDAYEDFVQAGAVPKTLGLLPGRVTYVIDKEGVVRHVFSSQFSANRHVAEPLAVVRQLAQS